MKEDNVKIIQICVEGTKYYVSTGSAYKDTVNTHNIFGLGDDGKVYQWAEHYIKGEFNPFDKVVGWKLYVPR